MKTWAKCRLQYWPHRIGRCLGFEGGSATNQMSKPFTVISIKKLEACAFILFILQTIDGMWVS